MDQFQRNGSILTEDLILKEKLLKDARNEQFKDETLGKTLINYIKGYESHDLIKDRLKEREQMKKSLEKGDEKLGLSVAELAKQIKLMFLNKSEGPLIERAKTYKQLTSGVMIKILKKIKDSEAFLYSRCLTMSTLRKENGYILEKLKRIRELVISLREKINKNRANKSRSSLTDSVEIQRISLNKMEKRGMKVGLANITSAEKTNIEKFMEKAMEEQIKEEEINSMNENKDKFEKKIQFNNDMLLSMDRENQVERKNLKETQKLYKNFLFRLLSEGKDYRYYKMFESFLYKFFFSF